jgi:hypothetical protein
MAARRSFLSVDPWCADADSNAMAGVTSGSLDAEAARDGDEAAR